MSTTKHKLTTGTDTLAGGSGSDLFVAPTVKQAGQLLGTLTTGDRLNGGGGTDALSGALVGKSVSLAMASVEQAVLSRGVTSAMTLDLARTTGLELLMLDHVRSDIRISHAGSLDALAVRSSHGIDVVVGGTNTKSVAVQGLAFEDADANVDFIHAGKSFKALAVTMNDSHVHLTGAVEARLVNIQSIGTAENSLLVDPGHVNTMIKKLAISGTADLDLRGGINYTFDALADVDAAFLTGNLTGSFNGLNLHSVRTGSGHDNIKIALLGGILGNPAKVDLGEGDDTLNIRNIVPTTMLLTGGDGNDTLQVQGGLPGLDTATVGFETLELWHPSGNYQLDSDFTAVLFKTVTGINSNVHLIGGTALTRIVASKGNDEIWLEDIGGSAGDMAQLTMGKGDDVLSLTKITIDSASQAYDGGTGYDLATVVGNVQNISTVFSRFEALQAFNGIGTYDLTGSGLKTMWFTNATAGAVTVEGFASGGMLALSDGPGGLLAIHVENAVASQSETLEINLSTSSSSIGSAANGLSMPNLSNLTLSLFANPADVYLGALGATGDHASLTIEGTQAATVRASTGADLFIDTVTITNTAGADIRHLDDGDTGLASTGIFIFGGSGSDVLIGGAGADFMATGAGNNTVYGSLGVDDITLSTGGGLDSFIFTNKNQSSVGSGDIIANFSAFDTIDIGAVVGSVAFIGNLATFGAGISALSTSHTSAFFDQSADTLYIDINHDGALAAGVDMAIELTALNSFVSSNLLV